MNKEIKKERNKGKECFFVKIKKAIFNFEEYEKFANEKTFKSIKYILKLMLIFVFIITIASTYVTYETINEFKEKMNKELPEFIIEDNLLKINNNSEQKQTVINIKNNKIGIIINSLQTETKDIDLSKFENSIILLEDKLIVNYENTNILKTNYKDLLKENNIKNVSNKTILNYINNIDTTKINTILFAIVFLSNFTVYLIITLLDIILLSILGFLISKIFKIKFQYKQIVKISIYALTLPIILTAVYIAINLITGFTIKYFQMAYNVISYIYLTTAILTIKTDIIKTKAEVLTIEKELEEIKKQKAEKETKKKEDEEIIKQKNKQKEKEKTKKKEDEEDKDEKNKKKPNKSLNPQDSKA